MIYTYRHEINVLTEFGFWRKQFPIQMFEYTRVENLTDWFNKV